MPITSIATFTMRRGREAAALRLIAAVKREAERTQPGTLVYLAHRVLGKDGKPGRQLYFYERYRNDRALHLHLASGSWQQVLAEWPRYFEGTPARGIKFFGVARVAAFARPGAIPAPGRPARR